MPNIYAEDMGHGTLIGAYWNARVGPTLIKSESGNAAWPSYVYKNESGEMVVGDEAFTYAQAYPDSDRVASGWKFSLDNDEKAFFGGTATGSDVVTVIMEKVISAAETQLSLKIDSVVPTCPAVFSDKSKNNLIAGIERVVPVKQLITEPAAACYRYVAAKDNYLMGDRDCAAVIDVGHGTTDVSVLKVEDGEATPIATEGIADLGGMNFTDVVIDMLLEQGL